jgi:hypothetical protein
MRLVIPATVIIAIVIGDNVHADPANPVRIPRGPAAVPAFSVLDLFVIRFDEVGYENVPASIEEPTERRFRSVSILTSLDSRFARRVIQSRDEINVRGSLKLAPDGFFVVELTYEAESETEDPDFKSRRAAQTTVSLQLDKRAELGGLISKWVTSEGEMHSKRLITVTISRLDSLW